LKYVVFRLFYPPVFLADRRDGKQKYHFLSVLGVSSEAGGEIEINMKGFQTCLLHSKKF
jgi:hypothetical protein